MAYDTMVYRPLENVSSLLSSMDYVPDLTEDECGTPESVQVSRAFLSDSQNSIIIITKPYNIFIKEVARNILYSALSKCRVMYYSDYGYDIKDHIDSMKSDYVFRNLSFDGYRVRDNMSEGCVDLYSNFAGLDNTRGRNYDIAILNVKDLSIDPDIYRNLSRSSVKSKLITLINVKNLHGTTNGYVI